jgi:APA family basic amino acid/polyamine antiporter
MEAEVSSPPGGTTSAAGSQAGSPHLFVRNSTGLVREISQRDNMILAAITGAPAAFLALTVFFVFSGLHNGNLYVAALLTLPLVFAFSYAFGLMTAAIPRSGGDYTIVTRVLTPSLGLVSSFCMMVGGVALSQAYLGRFAATLAVAPSLQTIGVVAHNRTLFRWGNDVATGHGWWFAIGLFVFVIGALAFWGGPKWVKRVMGIGFFGSTAGLLIATIIAIFTSHHTFVNDFNSTTRGFNGVADNYGGVLSAGAKAGVTASSGFSWTATIAVIGVWATSQIYTYFAAFAGGELRQASSRKTAHRMAIGGTIAILIEIFCIYFLIHSWGRPFLSAAFGGGFPATLGSSPAYFTLSAYQVGNTIYAVLICLSFFLVYPMFVSVSFLALTRTLFAYSFDGILPERVSSVSRRTNAPAFAIVVAFVILALFLAWAVFIATNALQVVVYATVIQLVAMMLVGLSAAVFPWRRPELFRASGVTWSVGRVPVVAIAGVAAMVGGAFIIWIFFHYSYFGLADKGKFFAWFGGTAVCALIFYAIASSVRHRQGTDLSLVYAEIPPE